MLHDMSLLSRDDADHKFLSEVFIKTQNACCMQVFKALKYMHTAELLHRDIKVSLCVPCTCAMQQPA